MEKIINGKEYDVDIELIHITTCGCVKKDEAGNIILDEDDKPIKIESSETFGKQDSDVDKYKKRKCLDCGQFRKRIKIITYNIDKKTKRKILDDEVTIL